MSKVRCSTAIVCCSVVPSGWTMVSCAVGPWSRPKLLEDLLHRQELALANSAALLDSYSYEHVLKRGFALVRGEDDEPLTSAASLSPGMAVSLQFHDARARALIDGGSAAPKRKAAKPEKQGTLL